MIKKIIIQLILLILASFLVYKIDLLINFKVLSRYDNKNKVQALYDDLIEKIIKWELQEQNTFKHRKPAFHEEGIEEIALITMIKDEEDIIYENLVWHFCIGFRKFIIIENNSKDHSRLLINKFKNKVKGKAQVIIIEDPIIEHIQGAFISGAMKLAHHIWPTVLWFFPVDADEFWYPIFKLNNILDNIPKRYNSILTVPYIYVPTENTERFDFSIPFYKSITHRLKFFLDQENKVTTIPTQDITMGKIVTRPILDANIDQDNHRLSKTNEDYTPNYASGNGLGLYMLHFPRRSITQIQKKYWNGAYANILGQQKGVIKPGDGYHWNSFITEVKNKGFIRASQDRFDEFVAEKSNCIEESFPMDLAFQLFTHVTQRR